MGGGADPRRAAAGLALVAVAFALAGWQLPTVVRSTHRAVTAPGLTPTTLELMPAATHGVSTDALLLAQQTIPRDVVYSVVVGAVPPLDGGTAAAVVPILQYWLLPRRYTADPKAAQWIVTYHESSELLGVPVKREIGLGPDANAVEVGP